MSAITVRGASIGRRFIGGNPDHFEWLVSCERDGRETFYETVSSREAQSSRDAVEVVKRRRRERD
jgi:hypothetical protein